MACLMRNCENLTVHSRNTGRVWLAVIATACWFAACPASGAELVNVTHDGTAGAENNPFDTLILDNNTDWAAINDGGRTVVTALDNATSGNNRLILIGVNDIPQFNAGGGPLNKGWVFETEFRILQGDANGRAFANFGVRAENETGQSAWVGLTDDGGAGGTGQIAFVQPSGVLTSTAADLNVDALIGDGQYHNFRLHKYLSRSGNVFNRTVDVFMDGNLVLTAPYNSLPADAAGQPDIQAFASNTPTPLSQANVDSIGFSLYDNLVQSNPNAVASGAGVVFMDFNGDSHDGGPQGSASDFEAVIPLTLTSTPGVSQFNLGDNPAGLVFNSDSGPSTSISFSNDPNAADMWDTSNAMLNDGFFFRGTEGATTVTINFDALEDNADHQLILFTGRTGLTGHDTQFEFDGTLADPGALDAVAAVFDFVSGIDQTSLTFEWLDPGNANADPDRVLSGIAIVQLQAVPEPSTLFLWMVIGIFAIGVARRGFVKRTSTT